MKKNVRAKYLGFEDWSIEKMTNKLRELENRIEEFTNKSKEEAGIDHSRFINFLHRYRQQLLAYRAEKFNSNL